MGPLKIDNPFAALDINLIIKSKDKKTKGVTIKP